MTTTQSDRIAQMTPINQRALLTRRMAADYLSIGLTKFKSFECSGDITGMKIGAGREWRFRRADLDDLIERIATNTTNQDRMKRGQR